MAGSPRGSIASGGKGDLRHILGTTTVELPEGHPKPKVGGAKRGGRGAGHGESPSGKDRTAGWGTPRQGSLPGELRVLARHLQIGCRGTGTRGNHPRIRCRHLTQQEIDRVTLCNTNKQTNKQKKKTDTHAFLRLHRLSRIPGLPDEGGCWNAASTLNKGGGLPATPRQFVPMCV